jgi:hypothetical protein
VSVGDVGTPSPQHAVARAVQRLTARAVRRASAPLGGLLGFGIWEWAVGGPSGSVMLLLVGAVASGLVMLGYGVQSVRRVLGRPAGAWGPLFWVASWIPYAYGLYISFGVGLRPLASPEFDLTPVAGMAAASYTVLGALVIRAQWKISEVHSLAQEMTGLSGGANPDLGVGNNRERALPQDEDEEVLG